MRDIGRVGTGNSPPALCHFNSFEKQGLALPTGDAMTRFAKTGLRRTLLATIFLSFSAPVALAGDAAATKVAANTQTDGTINGYTPRKRIDAHPRNRDRQVRVISTTDAGYIAPTRATQLTYNATRKVAANAPATGGVDLERKFERLLLRYLRESIDAVEFDTAYGRARAELLRRGERVGYPESVIVEQQPRRPHEPADGLLTEVANDGPLRPKAGIIRVSPAQKQLGRLRAAARYRKLDTENAARYFRYYRPNEAYDARFPSFVYLNSN